jgi:hypothetical protein
MALAFPNPDEFFYIIKKRMVGIKKRMVGRGRRWHGPDRGDGRALGDVNHAGNVAHFGVGDVPASAAGLGKEGGLINIACNEAARSTSTRCPLLSMMEHGIARASEILATAGAQSISTSRTVLNSSGHLLGTVASRPRPPNPLRWFVLRQKPSLIGLCPNCSHRCRHNNSRRS